MNSEKSKNGRIVRILSEPDDNPRKTHVVIDLILFEEEGGGVVYPGTAKDCYEWVRLQGFGYEVKPMTEDELKLYNDEENN